MNQKDAFFDTKHVMKDSNMKDGLIEEQPRVQMECG